MGRAPCCDKANVKRGPWSPEEDSKLKDYIERFGTGSNWIALPQKVGLKRCGKSCRLRWLNYLRPNIKHGEFSDEEDRIIFNLFITIGSRWSIIAAQLPGRTDNDIKNYWNTKLKKKLMGLIPNSHHRKQPAPRPPLPRTASLPPPPPPSPPPPPPPQLLFPSSYEIQSYQQQQQQPPLPSTYSLPPLSKGCNFSYMNNNYLFTTDNSATTTTTTTTSSSAATTVSSVLNSCYEPFPIKDQDLLDFGSDPGSCSSFEQQQFQAATTMIKQEEGELQWQRDNNGQMMDAGFDFEQGIGIGYWAEKMSDCFGIDCSDYLSSSGSGSSGINWMMDHHAGGGSQLMVDQDEKGLYYF
ncbi:hypothetical protein MLD38_008284 [Melastoma candidum]|uniref:Uncharacterized protein n=1 Tax=Melastoma candidum TaxID=119954 RepID=A0ACB9RTS0_9MYRT|nr:hypothetical protein MLD38_008284 [Melastoma candidum]